MSYDPNSAGLEYITMDQFQIVPDGGSADQSANLQLWANAVIAKKGVAVVSPGGIRGQILNQGLNLQGYGENSVLISPAGMDLLLAPDPTIGAPYSVASFPLTGFIRDVKLIIDNTTNPSVGPSTPFNRPFYPVVGTWTTGATYNVYDYVTVADGSVWQCIQQLFKGAGTAGSTEPSGSRGFVSDGNLLWQFIASGQIYAGPQALAFPASVGPGSPGDLFDPINGWDFDFSCIALPQALSSAQVTGGIYSQRSFYKCQFNGYIESCNSGLVLAPNNTNFTNPTIAPDTTMFGNKGGLYLANKYGLTWYNGTKDTVSNMQVTNSVTGGFAAQFLIGGNNDGGTGLDLSGYYSETGSQSSPALWISQKKTTANSAILSGGGANSCAQIIGEGSTFNDCSILLGTIYLAGEQIKFKGTEVTQATGVTVFDFGDGNSFGVGRQEAVGPLGRELIVSGADWDAARKQTGDFMFLGLTNAQTGMKGFDSLIIPAEELQPPAGGSFNYNKGFGQTESYISVPASFSGFIRFGLPSAQTIVAGSGAGVQARWPSGIPVIPVCSISHSANCNSTISLVDTTTSTTVSTRTVAYVTGLGFDYITLPVVTLTSGHTYAFQFLNDSSAALNIQFFGVRVYAQQLLASTSYTNYPALASDNGPFTAHSGGGQGGATVITDGAALVSVVAADNDSVVLSALAGAGVTGTYTFVTNSGAHILAVFPAPGGSISGGSTNASVTQAAGTTYGYYAYAPNIWRRWQVT